MNPGPQGASFQARRCRANHYPRIRGATDWFGSRISLPNRPATVRLPTVASIKLRGSTGPKARWTTSSAISARRSSMARVLVPPPLSAPNGATYNLYVPTSVPNVPAHAEPMPHLVQTPAIAKLIRRSTSTDPALCRTSLSDRLEGAALPR